jgi:hypothetical protein
MYKIIAIILAVMPIVLFLRAIFMRSKKRSQAVSEFKKQLDYAVWVILFFIGCAVVYSIGKLIYQFWTWSRFGRERGTADDAAREARKIREVVSRVHNDYTEWSGPQRVRDCPRRPTIFCAVASRSSRFGGPFAIRSRHSRFRGSWRTTNGACRVRAFYSCGRSLASTI